MIEKDKPLSFGFYQELPRWQHLVSPHWLACLTAGKQITAAPAGNWCLLEIGFNAMNAYLQGHIPAASYVDTTEFEQGPLWNKVADTVLIDLLLSCGIRHDTTVVLYARNPLAAARAAHLMLYAGVEDVRLLDGGYAAWTRLQFPLEQGPLLRLPVAREFGSHYPARSRDPCNPVVRRVDASYERFRNNLENEQSGSPAPCSPMPHLERD